MVKKLTTDMRSQLGRGKEGHAATSVYSDVHGIRNTLCGRLTTKINVFKKTDCHEWNPSNDLLKRAKTNEALNPCYSDSRNL